MRPCQSSHRVIANAGSHKTRRQTQEKVQLGSATSPSYPPTDKVDFQINICDKIKPASEYTQRNYVLIVEIAR
jgi:hypothetical protein